MRPLVLLVVLLASAVSQAAASDPEPLSARQAMVALSAALARGDIAQAKESSVTYQEFSDLSRRGLEPEAYRQALDGFLRELAAELAAGLVLQQAVCADVVILPKSPKTRRQLVMAVLHVTFRAPGQAEEIGPVVFTFVELHGQWKFLLRK